MPAKKPNPTATDFSVFTDEQLAMLLNVGGQARWLAAQELASRHPLADPNQPAAKNA